MAHASRLPVTFPDQQPDEEVFVYARRYWIAFLPILLFTLLVTVLGLVMIFFLANGGVDRNIVVLTGSAFLLLMLLLLLIEFFDFYFDLHIVTDRRVIDIDQKRLFNRQIAKLLLEDVQDVETSVKGILPTLFNYGDVTIQTAGTKPNFLFNQIQHPREVAIIILDLSEQTRNGVPVADRRPTGPMEAIIDGVLIPREPDEEA